MMLRTPAKKLLLCTLVIALVLACFGCSSTEDNAYSTQIESIPISFGELAMTPGNIHQHV